MTNPTTYSQQQPCHGRMLLKPVTTMEELSPHPMATQRHTLQSITIERRYLDWVVLGLALNGLVGTLFGRVIIPHSYFGAPINQIIWMIMMTFVFTRLLYIMILCAVLNYLQPAKCQVPMIMLLNFSFFHTRDFFKI